MRQRFIALLGILALAITILPGLPELAWSDQSCCNGVMCPMHASHESSTHCDMDMNHSGAAWNTCGTQNGHYTSTTPIVLLAPVTLSRALATGLALPALGRFFPDAERPIDSPPPRLAVIA